MATLRQIRTVQPALPRSAGAQYHPSLRSAINLPAPNLSRRVGLIIVKHHVLFMLRRSLYLIVTHELLAIGSILPSSCRLNVRPVRCTLGFRVRRSRVSVCGTPPLTAGLRALPNSRSRTFPRNQIRNWTVLVRPELPALHASIDLTAYPLTAQPSGWSDQPRAKGYISRHPLR
jgi:hypothetical protein